MSTPLPPECERYLREVAKGLGPLSDAERAEVLEELSSHFRDRLAQGKADPLQGFEPATSLAAAFVGERALHGALAQGTSWALVRALRIAGRDSLLALGAVLPLVLVHVVAVGFVVTGALKPFAPERLGLWVGGGNFYVGEGRAGLTEVLGWWGVPVLMVTGALLFWVANRGLRALVRWRLASARPF